MKYLIPLCLIFVGCARVADSNKVQNNFVEKVSYDSLIPSQTTSEANVRAMTLLSYPLKKDVANWNYDISEETKASWEMFLESLKFSNRLTTSFQSEMNPIAKIQEMVTIVQSAGESRDQAYKKIAPLKKMLQKLDNEMISIKEEKTPKELESFICFYAKKPASGKNYECKSASDAEYSKEKTASNCKDFSKFNFIDVGTDLNIKIQESQLACSDLQKSIDTLKAQSKTIDDQIGFEISVRSAGESVVIDLLQSVEKSVPGLVLIATGATIEKNKDPSDPISKLVINENNEIETISLIIDFGPNLSSGAGKVEYSVENGNIRNLSFKQESNGVWTLRFDLITSDFVIKANLSYSVHPTLGMRFVGDAHFHYPNNEIRKGVMKLEFDLK